jgi:hypothetical protein
MANADNLIGHGFDSKPDRINKKGRPRKLPELDRLLIELLGERGKESRMRELLSSLIELAIGGNIRAAEMILNRAYGKPKESIDLTSNGDSMRQKTTIIFSDDSAEDENRLILGAAGDVCDRYGNFICTIPGNKMHLFKFDIHFVGNDGLQALDYDGTGIVSADRD